MVDYKEAQKNYIKNKVGYHLRKHKAIHHHLRKKQRTIALIGVILVSIALFLFTSPIYGAGAFVGGMILYFIGFFDFIEKEIEGETKGDWGGGMSDEDDYAQLRFGPTGTTIEERFYTKHGVDSKVNPNPGQRRRGPA